MTNHKQQAASEYIVKRMKIAAVNRDLEALQDIHRRGELKAQEEEWPEELREKQWKIGCILRVDLEELLEAEEACRNGMIDKLFSNK